MGRPGLRIKPPDGIFPAGRKWASLRRIAGCDGGLIVGDDPPKAGTSQPTGISPQGVGLSRKKWHTTIGQHFLQGFLGSEPSFGQPGGVFLGRPDQPAHHESSIYSYTASLDRRFPSGNRGEFFWARLISGPTMNHPSIHSRLPWIWKFQPGNRRKTGLPDQRAHKHFEGGQ
jgi:hypothetical protein